MSDVREALKGLRKENPITGQRYCIQEGLVDTICGIIEENVSQGDLYINFEILVMKLEYLGFVTDIDFLTELFSFLTKKGIISIELKSKLPTFSKEPTLYRICLSKEKWIGELI